MDMLILLVTVFCALWGPSATLDKKEVCYGQDLAFPEHIQRNIQQGPLYFTPSNGGKRKILMENGKAKDPRLKVGKFTTSLTLLTKKDEGVYALTNGSTIIDELQLKIKDCAEEIIKDYMDEWSYRLPVLIHYVEYTSPHNEDETLVLWNSTNPQSEQRKGVVKNYFWTISGVTQADNGYYNFRKKEGTLRSRILLTVKEKTRYYDSKGNEDLLIMTPWTRRPWTVTFKDVETKHVTIIENGNLVWDVNRFSGRISIQSNGIKIKSVKAMDSGTYEFRDPQGNLAFSAHVSVDDRVSHPQVTYVVVAVVAVVLGLCCCFCCKRKCCCKKNKSADTATSAVTYHDKSDSAASSPAVYYHGTSQPTGPSYPIQTSSIYTPHPANPPAYTGTVAVSIEQPPSQPNTAVYPPQPASVYPPQPASVYPPQPASVYPPQPASVYPPQPASANPPQPEPSLYPPLSEFGPPASQGSAATPTFSSDMFSPDAEPRFQLKGLAFPSAPPLSSDVPICDVYNSDKLSFL
ncbi:uncharacterized protein LOC111607014 isoform X1 [Xiphophorus maculatus]|uniref:Uncharacterized LOC111607014 n=1 Tax=Xiphophorus maculatus TaxID=8083 RepID=M4A223_XIPMA|nr:uncharacterized protein LOC111607014 isoform X1 [Xiphophorus maculatus]XP_023184515.1 uncharacterized protein LOC111607014 isoform X1 [Xiphophorus maculatus]